MASQPASDLPLWFPVAFLGLWLVVGALLSELGGWASLARRFPSGGARPTGQRLRRQVVGMGWVSENGVTTLIPTPAGLYLYSHPLFRFRRPPVLVPWTAIRHVGQSGRLWWRADVFDLGGVTQVRVRRDGYAALVGYLARGASPPAL